MQLTNNFYKYV